MLRSLALAALFVCSACAAILPDRIGDHQRKSVSPIEVSSDPQVRANWAEYGLETAEKDDYGTFQVTVARFKDPTGAYAGALSAHQFRRVGNYLVDCNCSEKVFPLVEAALPSVSHGAIPTLSSYFPLAGLIRYSERYILGPENLKGYLIPASAVDFDFGTEGEIGQYRTPEGTVLLGVFSFPTPSIARQQLPQFQKISGATAKRTGPLVAIAIGPAAASAKLLDAVRYQGVVEEDQEPPPKPLEIQPQTAGQMVLAILSLAGLLLGFCLISGLAVGGGLWLARRFGYSGAEGSLITLHLEGK